MKSILDRNFKYVPAAKTDLKKTFARLRKEQAERDKTRAEVVQMKRERK